MLRRSVDAVDQPAFVFPDNYVLRAGAKMKVVMKFNRKISSFKSTLQIYCTGLVD